MSTVLATVLGTAIAIGTGLAIYYSGILVPSCGTVGGRVCNGYGTCVSGVCVCQDAWSGPDCGNTLCPLFDATTGSVCAGRGFCSKFLANVPLPCNNTQGGDWGSSACVAAMKNNPSPFAIPRCTCDSPFVSANGGFCNVNMCPENTEKLVCSGYGLPTVNYTDNNTITGLGCQCNQTWVFASNNSPRQRQSPRQSQSRIL
jgi:hypothetical protein